MIKEVKISQLTPEDAALASAARHATALSYSPYSHFNVGAAVLLANGKTVQGANQENASYPVGICAERSTIATAHNLYPQVPITAIALAAKDMSGEFTQEVVSPCGMCRQAITECEKRFKNRIRIIMTSREKALIAEGISDLLPIAFT